MRIGIGGHYKLFKSGEIIPKLNGCVKAPEVVFEAPAVCPICGETLVREEDTADIRCVNPSCPAQTVRTISYFASRDAMNIMGLGETLVEALVKNDYLENYADIYELQNVRDELVEKGIVGKEKNTDKLLGEIEKSKNNPPERLLTGLGIRNVGKTTAKSIIRHFHSFEALSQATLEELTAVDDIGEICASSIYEFFHEEQNVEILERLKSAGLTMEEVDSSIDDKFSGKTFVITGTLTTMKRQEAAALIENHGGKVTGSVYKKTDYLLAGENAGSKLTKANDLGIQVISEEDLQTMLES
jgi:DNA ligase (NAD+)